jgi:hypothetical protein
MNRLRVLSVKLYGEPPPKGSPRSTMLRWIRGFYIKQLPLIVPVYVVVLVWASQTWVLIVLAASSLVWLQGLVSLSVRIPREERRERATNLSGR